jgi:hypothetical protein
MIFTNDDKMKFERVKSMPRLKREIISYLFDYIVRKGTDQWWNYKGEFIYDGTTYDLECDCRYDNQMFTYRNLHIQYKQEVINLEAPENQYLIQ